MVVTLLVLVFDGDGVMITLLQTVVVGGGGDGCVVYGG